MGPPRRFTAEMDAMNADLTGKWATFLWRRVEPWFLVNILPPSIFPSSIHLLIWGLKRRRVMLRNEIMRSPQRSSDLAPVPGFLLKVDLMYSVN